MSNRILKESICTSDTINALSLFDEVVFYRLIVNCDDYGRFDGRAPIIKSRLFPLKSDLSEREIESAVERLSKAGLLILYKSGGKPYIQLVTWDRHQQIRAKRSKYPPPESACSQMISDDAPIQSNTNTNTNSNQKKNANPNGAESAPAKKKHGEYGWVMLTDEEYEKLLGELGEAELKRCIAYIDESAQATLNKNGWKDWCCVVKKCSKNGWGRKPKEESAKKPSYDLQELERLAREYVPSL